MGFALVMVSDTRYREEREGRESSDETTPMFKRLVEQAGYRLISRVVVPDEAEMIVEAVERAVRDGADIVVTSGGTGLSKRDVTLEALSRLFEKRIPGFGELLRLESYREIGSAAMLTRADAGVYKGTIIFCLPGSPNAVHTALTKLILPEAEHLAFHIKKEGG
ncbi:MAG: molybdenum cofactor biosynthesis protein MoaB [Candidatus Freyarchaeota archaeon]|nr:molybdenum cofactor biosynthesis protein MoaB [Candidatus Jordarchaeia archaeon]